MSPMADTPSTGPPATRDRAIEQQLREMNEALLVSSVRQHELAEQALKAEAAARETAGLLRAATDNASVGLVSLDRERRYKFANPAYCKILGLPADIIGKGPAELLPSVYTEQIAPHLDRAFAGQRVAYELVQPVADRADGQSNHYAVVYEPERDGDGNVTGVVVVIFDITERKQAQEAVTRLAAIVESSQDAIVGKTLQGTITSWNRGAETIFGFAAEEMIGRSILRLIPPERQAEEIEINSRIARGESVRDFETVRLRKDGSTIELSVAVSPIKDASGTIVGVSKVARDITERKHIEEHNGLLMAEVNHRSMNLLAVVQAVAQQTARSGDPATFVEHLCERIGGLAASQYLLVKSQWRGIEVANLVEAQLAHFKDLIGTRVLLEGPPVRLTPAAAQGIGMALHELATNAAKYGALSNSEGRVRICWQVTAAQKPTFSMSWLEDGGPKVASPTRKGFGQTVIGRMVEAAVDGTAEIDYRESGLSWKLSALGAKTLERDR
jgi:PAS domain S-box-containing protein